MRITPAIVGLIAGFLAALLQAFFHVIPPPAYGVCIACHMRDFVNWLFSLPVAPVSKNIPVFTILGILLGAFIAARINGEFRWKVMRVPWQRPWMEFIWGMLVMIFALIMGGCPIRTALKTAYLDITAMIGLLSIFIGVFLGCITINILSRR